MARFIKHYFFVWGGGELGGAGSTNQFSCGPVKLSSYYLIFQNTLHKMILDQRLFGSLFTCPYTPQCFYSQLPDIHNNTTTKIALMGAVLLLRIWEVLASFLFSHTSPSLYPAAVGNVAVISQSYAASSTLCFPVLRSLNIIVCTIT